jgi:hypothetical protein
MCTQCDDLRQKISCTRELLVELTDPSSVVLTQADAEILEEELETLVASHK